MMQPIAGGALARPFVTHHNALDIQLFLRVAPELYLKRLVVGGLERVYEINRNFRNEGISTQHNPEFTMLEFYQAYSDYQELMVMTEEMLSSCAREAAGSDRIKFGGHEISLAPPYSRVSLREGARAAAAATAGRSRQRRRSPRARDRGGARASAASRGARVVGGGKDRDRNLRAPQRGRAGAADLRVRLSDRGLAALETEAGRSRHGGALRAVYRRVRGGERLQRAQRSGGAAPPVRGAARRPGGRRRRSARDGRGLHPGARVRIAADSGGRRRHRPPRDAPDRQPVHPRRHPVPAHEAAGAGRRVMDDSSLRALHRPPVPAGPAQAGLHLGDLPHLGARRHGRRDGPADFAGAHDRPAGGARAIGSSGRRRTSTCRESAASPIPRRRCGRC